MKHKLARLLSLTLVSATIFGLLAPAALADTTIGTTITVRDATSANNDTIQVIGLNGGAATFTGSITSVDLTATRTWTLPDADGAFTLLGNASTGTGSVVLATSPTLVTPVLGVATATTLSVSGALAANGGITFDAATDTVGAHTLSGTLDLATNSITNGGTITATSFVGALTGNASTATSATTAGTVTTAAQPAITSVGTLTTLTVDDITINGNTISSAGASTLAINPTAGQAITFDGAVTLDAGVIAGVTSITSTSFIGALTGNASTATALAANGANCAAGQAPLGVDASGAVEGCTAYIASTLTDGVTDALDIQEGTNNYININTTNAAENVSFGNATTNPSFTFLGAGAVTATSFSGPAGGAVTATSFSGALTGNVTGNVSGTAATVTAAAQPAITSVGTLTTLTVDDITLNGNTISSAGASTLAINPTAGQAITFDGTVTLDAGVIAGVTSITSTSFIGALTGNASTATALAANGANCAAGQAPLGVDASGAVEGCTAYIASTLTDGVTDALDIQEGTNNYININTTNAAENISFGNATTNPTFTFLGAGAVTATAFSGPLTGNVTGNVSGTAATVTAAAQPAITSVGTLTTLTVDDITLNGNTISSAGASTLAINPTAGQAITFDGTVTLDAGVIAGVTSITSTAGDFTTLSVSGALAANGGITFDAATDTLGAHTLGGTLDAATNILTNIGNAGTDFLANGGLTLANALTVTTGGATIGGHITSTGPTAVDATTGTCSTVTVTGTDTRGTIVATCTIGQTVIVTFGAAYTTAPICVVSPANAEAVTGNAHLVSSTTNMTLTSVAAATAGDWKYHCIE